MHGWGLGMVEHLVPGLGSSVTENEIMSQQYNYQHHKYVISQRAVQKYSKRTSAIVSGSRVEPLCQISATALLSQWNNIFCLAHWCPQVLTALTIGEQFLPQNRFDYLGWRPMSLDPPTRPKGTPAFWPWGISIEIHFVHWVSRIKEDPGQPGRKSCHHSMSSWALRDMGM